MVGRTWDETLNGGTYKGVGTKKVGRVCDGGGGMPMANVPPFVLSQRRATISKRWHVDRMRKMVGRIFDSSEKVARRRDGRHNRSNDGTYP